MGDVFELLVADFFKSFAFGRELLVDLDDLFSHHFVSLFSTAHEREVGAGGEALVPVRIKTHAKDDRLARGPALFDIRHATKLRAHLQAVKKRSVICWPEAWFPAINSRREDQPPPLACN